MGSAYPGSELFAAAVFWAVALAAALPAYAITRRSRQGRARTAIAYLIGFTLGVGATVGIWLLTGSWGSPASFNAGIGGAFLGPFTGVAHGMLRRPRRRSRWSVT